MFDFESVRPLAILIGGMFTLACTPRSEGSIKDSETSDAAVTEADAVDPAMTGFGSTTGSESTTGSKPTTMTGSGSGGPDTDALDSDTGMPQPSEEPMAHVDFEQSTWLADTNCCKWLYDPRDDEGFRVPLEGARDDLNAWISPSIALDGERSFGARLDSKDGCIEKQRVEFEIASREYFEHSLETARYYGVAVYVHPQSQDIVKPTIFFQAWQSHDVTYARYPPLSLVLEPGPDYLWSVYTSTGGSDPSDAPGDKSLIYTSPNGLKKGVWYRFVVWFKPSVNKSGAVRVWLDGEERVAQTHERNFGYPPRAESPGKINDWFQVRFGAYRGRICTDPPTLTGRTILMFDEAKIGMSYASVVP